MNLRPAGLTEQLRSCPGMWVAVKDQAVVHADPEPGGLLAWLRENASVPDQIFWNDGAANDPLDL